ncbi:MAG TPA: DPP IV N-terminal domain-containing protein [Edaphocola sp.]|nr:DPP IV N-terminal domain-containing protein [Edaphocola sp.]
MKTLLKTILAISFISISFITNAQTKKITLEDIWLKGTFSPKGVPGFNVMNDGKHYLKIDAVNGESNLNIYDLAANKLKSKLLNISNLRYGDQEIKFNKFEFSNDEQKVLIFEEAEPIYRRSVLYKTYIYDFKNKSLNLLDKDKVLHASFSPNGSKIAYVKNNNIFINDLSNTETLQITFDGAKNNIINGNCDWVYEEEFSFSRAFEWSPNGAYLAFYKFDESKVKEYTMLFYNGDNYPEPYTYKYPKAGEDNSIVSIHIYQLANNKTQKADIGSNTDQYIPRIKWTNQNDALCITRMNRHQNNLDLLLTNANTGVSKLIYNETNKYYIDITDNLYFLPDNKSLMLSSERDGNNQIYIWNWDNKNLKAITKGENEVKDILGYDVKNNLVYYTISEDIFNTALLSVNISNNKINIISKKKGTHNVQAYNGFEYFMDVYSNSTTPPVFSLIDNKGKTIRVLEENKALTKKIENYNFVTPEFINIPNAQGVQLNAYILKPKDFDQNKKYPVLMYQYSGPGSQQVLNKFPLDNILWHQFLVQKGYLVVVADGTGTGARGEEFKKKTYLQLGKMESDDQISIAEYLAKQSYVDKNRIGIWGWSYGGFMSTTCLLKAPELFKAAIAVAPVTSWRYYDNIYTERFMRTPKENPKGYDDNAPLSMVKNLKGKYLLIHGITDDNVHLQNATEISKELVNANKDFDAFYYTNKNHSIYGGYTRYNLYRKMTDFILNNL